ncbi:hypothetical protein MKW98_031943 [Papaver atlanticum]|uniref:Uncharacterized protein n=1 Tax=Papaver atlanticum TaxID=357466 RepID=A0AAD4SF04_9MAGN|nr:hypothetical protein MKW98_031943 [Papaver atlanticum]
MGSGRQNPPGTVSGRGLGEAAQCLVVNSLQLPREVQTHAVPPPYNGTAHYSTGRVGEYHHGQGHVRPVPVSVLLTPMCPSHTLFQINRSTDMGTHMLLLPANLAYDQNRQRPSYPPYAATTNTRGQHHPRMYCGGGFQQSAGSPIPDANMLQYPPRNVSPVTVGNQ